MDARYNTQQTPSKNKNKTRASKLTVTNFASYITIMWLMFRQHYDDALKTIEHVC